MTKHISWITVAALFLLIVFAKQAGAAPCTLQPKPGITVEQILIATTRVEGIDVTNIIVAWPTTDPNLVCCTRAVYNRQAWQVILDQQIPRGIVTLKDFVLAITPPGGEKTAAENAVCQAMADRILPALPIVIRNTQRADGARPLKVLRDPAAPYSATNPLLNLLAGGMQVYVEAGRPCDRLPVINTTTAGQWLYTTNLAGQRGIALCK